jgi:hypothetical protein
MEQVSLYNAHVPKEVFEFASFLPSYEVYQAQPGNKQRIGLRLRDDAHSDDTFICYLKGLEKFPLVDMAKLKGNRMRKENVPPRL